MKRCRGPLLAVLLLCAGCVQNRADETGTDLGTRPVSFVLDRLGGGHDALNAHRGHVVLLDLWASWCPPCKEELPALSALAASDPKLVVLAANQGETSSVAADVVNKLHLRMPVLLDREQQYGAAYATVGLPTAVILGSDGKIAALETGAHSIDQWHAIIARATRQ